MPYQPPSRTSHGTRMRAIRRTGGDSPWASCWSKHPKSTIHRMFEASRMANTSHRIFGSTPIPRYLQLAELVRQRVAKGHWPSGSILPSIEQLMKEFDVARVTVRQAIALLAEEGLLSPQRGRGTFVTGKPGARRQLRVETTLDDLVAMYSGDRPDHATLAEAVADPVLSDKDGIKAPKYYYLRRVHSRNGERYC